MNRVYTLEGFKVVECPPLKTGEIRIKPAGFGLNRLDLELMKRNPELPAGLEVAGTVSEVGPGVCTFMPGDRVMSLVRTGGFSESVVAEESCTLEVSKNLDLASAAALPESLFTIWLNLIRLGKAQNGETVLITGAAGGVGVHAALAARALGMVPIVVSRSPYRLRQLEELGFNRTALLNDRCLGIDPETVDVIFDVLGPNMFQEYFSVLRKHGRIAMVDALLGDASQVDFGLVFEKELSITGSLLRPQSDEVKAQLREELRAFVLPALMNEAISPVIGKAFSGFESLPEAIEFLRRGSAFGKVLVKA